MKAQIKGNKFPSSVKVILLLVPIFFSCNHEVSELKNENILLSKKVDSLSNELLYYKLQRIDDENETKSNTSNNEEMALSTFKDHTDFYCKNCDYKDLKVRKLSENTFDISMNKRSNARHINNSWTGVVVRITFNSEGSYVIKNLKGTYDFGCQ